MGECTGGWISDSDEEEGNSSGYGKTLIDLNKPPVADYSDGERDGHATMESLNSVLLHQFYLRSRNQGPEEENHYGIPATVVPVAKSTPQNALREKGKRAARARASNTAKKGKLEVPSEETVEAVNAAIRRAIPAPKRREAVNIEAQPAKQGVTEEEVVQYLRHNDSIRSADLVEKFGCLLPTRESKQAFALILRKISLLRMIDGVHYIVLRPQC